MNRGTEALIVPRRQVFLKFIDIPSVDNAEIRKMAEFQALREIPYAKEDVVIGYRNLGSYKDGFSSLMLVVGGKAKIKEMISKKENRNLKIRSVGLYTELLYLFILNKGFINQKETRLIINIGEEYTEIMVVNKLRPVFSREFKNSGRFLEEIEHSVRFYERNRSNSEIERMVILHSLHVDIEEARPYIERYFEIEIDFYEYRDDIENTGLADEVNLLPAEISDREAKVQNKKESVFTYSLIGLVVILFFVFYFYKMEKTEKFLQRLSSRIDEIAPQAENLAGFLRKTEIAKGKIKEGNFIAGVLRASYNLVPSDIRLSAVSYDGKESIFYKGEAKDMSSIVVFIKRLEGSGYFDSAQIRNVIDRELRGERFRDFDIQCNINSSQT